MNFLKRKNGIKTPLALKIVITIQFLLVVGSLSKWTLIYGVIDPVFITYSSLLLLFLLAIWNMRKWGVIAFILITVLDAAGAFSGYGFSPISFAVFAFIRGTVIIPALLYWKKMGQKRLPHHASGADQAGPDELMRHTSNGPEMTQQNQKINPEIERKLKKSGKIYIHIGTGLLIFAAIAGLTIFYIAPSRWTLISRLFFPGVLFAGIGIRQYHLRDKRDIRKTSFQMYGVEEPEISWKCPKCKNENPNYSYGCESCGYSLN
jgi:hypothetical protein